MRIAVIDDNTQAREQLCAYARTWLDDRHLVGEVCPFASADDFFCRMATAILFAAAPRLHPG